MDRSTRIIQLAAGIAIAFMTLALSLGKLEIVWIIPLVGLILLFIGSFLLNWKVGWVLIILGFAIFFVSGVLFAVLQRLQPPFGP
jgi:hypothetical protein